MNDSNTLILADGARSALVDVEHALQRQKNCQTPAEARAGIQRLTERVLSWAAVSSGEPVDYDDLFQTAMGNRVRRVVGAALLRLLADNAVIFDDPAFSVKATALFDSVFEHTLYDKINLSVSDQAYKKHQALRSQPYNAVTIVTEATESLPALGPKVNLRHGLMRALNAKPVTEILYPFLPKSLRKTYLNDALAAAEAVQESEGRDLRRAYTSALTAIQEYRDEIDAYGIGYVPQVLGPIADTLKERVEAFYNSSPAAQPADVNVELTAKRYPLHEEGREFRLQLYLTNDGPGDALGVYLAVNDFVSVLPQKIDVELGDRTPGSYLVSLLAIVEEASDEAAIEVVLHWDDAEGHHDKAIMLTLHSQPTGFDWEELEWQNPYDLEPVFQAEDLVGRNEILGRFACPSGPSLKFLRRSVVVCETAGSWQQR